MRSFKTPATAFHTAGAGQETDEETGQEPLQKPAARQPLRRMMTAQIP
jgi:hypothetical protein